MGDVTRVITLGIGPSATIDGLILVGLNPNDVQVSIPGCITATDAGVGALSLADALFGAVVVVDAGVGSVTVSDTACGINLPMIHEDESGYWKFEDDSDVEWS